MTTPTLKLVTAEQAQAAIDYYGGLDPYASNYQNRNVVGLARAIIALHEALAAEKARADDAEALSQSTLDREAATAARYDARLDAAEARVAVLEARTPVAWMGREGYFTTDPHQASAHAHHGTPLTPLYTSKVRETKE